MENLGIQVPESYRFRFSEFGTTVAASAQLTQLTEAVTFSEHNAMFSNPLTLSLSLTKLGPLNSCLGFRV